MTSDEKEKTNKVLLLLLVGAIAMVVMPVTDYSCRRESIAAATPIANAATRAG